MSQQTDAQWAELLDEADERAEAVADAMIGRLMFRHSMRQSLPGAENEQIALELECMVRELERIRDGMLGAEQVPA